MITVNVGYDNLPTLLKWLNSSVHPNRNEDEFIESATSILNAISAVIANFYVDNKLAGGVSYSIGLDLHRGLVLDVQTIISPEYRDNHTLNKFIINHIRNVCKESNTTTYCRSKHITPDSIIVNFKGV